jgi:flagellar basal-body rod protein FlgB
MEPRLFASRTLRGLTAALDGLSQRQQTIAANIANVDTPFYQASDVQFEAALQRALGAEAGVPLVRTHAAHLTAAGAPPATRFDDLVSRSRVVETARRNDGNTVDLDREMARLAETGLRYSAVASLVAARYASLRTAISEGKR